MMHSKNLMHTSSSKHAKHTRVEEDTLCASFNLAANEPMPDYKNIKIHEDTHKRLKSHGNMGESFDDLINRILDDWEEEEMEECDK